MTAFGAAKIVKRNSSFDYVELNGSELDKLVKKALNDKDAKILVQELTNNIYEISEAKGTEFTYNNKKGNTILLTLKSSNDVQLLFSEFNGNVKVGAGVLQDINGNKGIEIFDVKQGKMYNTSAIEIVNGKSEITWKEGPYVPREKNPNNNSQQEVTASLTWDSCSICTSVCGTIYSLGCGVTSYFACVVACAPIGTAACPVICGFVFSAICGAGGTFITCPQACTSMGYCE